MTTFTLIEIRSRVFRVLAAMACILPMIANGTASAASGEQVRFDFESGSLGDWQIVEGTFDKLLTDRAMFRNPQNRGKKWNKQGTYFLNTTETTEGGFNDKLTGVVESPVFVLDAPKITLLVGGGAGSETYVALCTDDGEEQFRASGINDEIMQSITWNAAALVGKQVFVRIVDQSQGAWGHVTFDDLQAVGRIDLQATAAYRANRVKLAAERLARADAQRVARTKALTDPENLFARGAPHVYRGEHLGAVSMPIGGIGAGSIQINGAAERHMWQIFNNYYPAALPHSFFAVRLKPTGGQPILRALQTTGVGPFAPIKELTFRGEYPFGWYDFADPSLPVRLSLEAYSPMIPLDEKNSAIPCAIFTVTAENTSDSAVEVSFLAAQQNAVGLGGETLDKGPKPVDGRNYPGYGGNCNAVSTDRNASFLHMTAQMPPKAECYGDMVLAALSGDVSGAASWVTLEALAKDIAPDGKLDGPASAGPTAAGQSVDGALAAAARLAPGEKHTVTFVLTWHFPNGVFGGNRNAGGAKAGWRHEGNMYANWWRDAMDVARYVIGDFDSLVGRTRAYHDTFYESNLPYWLLDRITSQTAILRSQTCFWAKDNYFGGWEGLCRHKGCCPGNCAHVWHYAQSHARLFPAIARRMREESLSYQDAAGGIPFRHPAGKKATDGQCGEILEAYREHLCGVDGAWLHANWPRIQKAMEFVIATWDQDEDGVMAGPQHNTLDTELGGSSSWLGSLYVAALAASEKMAALEGDAAAATRYAKICAGGATQQNATLFNGEYYIQIPGAKSQRDYNNGCSIDQMLGQWWAGQLDLGWFYPRDRVSSAMKALFKHNFRPDFHGVPQKPRKFVADEDAGLQMICWPKGDRPPNHILYADEVMSGFEYSAAAMMVQAGLLTEGFAVVHAAAERYDGRERTGLAGDLQSGRSAWGYSGNPFGDDECGKFYARAMSIHSMLLACQGFIYDGPAGVIGFAPLWQPKDHRSFFSGAEGWGLFSQAVDGATQTDRIDMRHGRLVVSSLVFTPAEGVKASGVAVMVGGKPAKTTHKLADGRVTISLPEKATVAAGEALVVTIE